jgi:hypothetical protein
MSEAAITRFDIPGEGSLGYLNTPLLELVDETLQPEKMSVWLVSEKTKESV